MAIILDQSVIDQQRNEITITIRKPILESYISGITVIGDYTSRKPNDISLNAVKSLIDCGISKGYISSGYTLHGHRDLDATTCPGNVFYNEIRTWPKYRATARSFSMPQFEATEDSIVSQYP